MAKAKRTTCIDLASELSDASLADVKRDDLLALLRSISTAEVYCVPWGDTVVLAADRWERVNAAACRCLKDVKL